MVGRAVLGDRLYPDRTWRRPTSDLPICDGKGVPVSYVLNVIYMLLLFLGSPWILVSALRYGKYREGLGAKLLGWVPSRTHDSPCIWIHGVSVGEVNLMGPLIKELRRQLPQYECVISTTTRTGYQLAKTKYGHHLVFYCPLDFSWAVSAAMRRIRPDLLILIELELWPNLISTAWSRGVKTIVVNGRLSQSSWRGYRRIRPLVGRLLRRLDVIAAQNDEYADRFLDLGARTHAVHVTGSLKFDGAETDRENPRTRDLSRLARLDAEDVVFLAGSTQSPEESLALDVYRDLSPSFPQLRLIIVPRHPERFDEVAQLLDRSGKRWQRRSQLEPDVGHDPARVLLVDSVGELGAWWGTAHIALVGGSLGRRGGQNMIEPAAYGAAVTFGPNTRNFREVVTAMLQADAAVVVSDFDELSAFVTRCLDAPDFRRKLGRRAQQLVRQHLGATERSVALIRDLSSGPKIGQTNVGRPHAASSSACVRTGASHII